MNFDINLDNLVEFKTKLRKKYPQLTEVDMQHHLGREDDMLRIIEYKLRKTQQEMQDIIAKL
jgi:hypothetical protein